MKGTMAALCRAVSSCLKRPRSLKVASTALTALQNTLSASAGGAATSRKHCDDNVGWTCTVAPPPSAEHPRCDGPLTSPCCNAIFVTTWRGGGALDVGPEQGGGKPRQARLVVRNCHAGV